MEHILKFEIGSSISSFVPLGLWTRLTGINLVIAAWHIVSDQDVEHVKGLYSYRNERQFLDDVEYLLRHYRPVSLADVLQHLDGQNRLPKQSVLFTFDDGFREVYETIAPVLSRKGIPGVFFLITGAIDNHDLCHPQKKSLVIRALERNTDSLARQECSRRLAKAGIGDPNLIRGVGSIYYRQRHVLDDLGAILGYDFSFYVASVRPYLTSDEIRRLMKEGFAFGAHSVDHPRYTELSLEEQWAQTSESLNFISARFNYDCRTFAFPYTENGISPEFYRRAFSSNTIQATFGIGSFIEGVHRRHLPRICLEGTDHRAKRILTYEFGRALWHRFSAQRPWNLEG
jgi:peptidoglycan/xylan/chitin deacetylase (PgdA/CDA1 family)